MNFGKHIAIERNEALSSPLSMIAYDWPGRSALRVPDPLHSKKVNGSGWPFSSLLSGQLLGKCHKKFNVLLVRWVRATPRLPAASSEKSLQEKKKSSEFPPTASPGSDIKITERKEEEEKTPFS